MAFHDINKLIYEATNIIKQIFYMKSRLLPILFALSAIGFENPTYSQIGIGTTTPHASAILDIESTSKGFLPPRMSTSQRDLINGGSPTQGLMIYNTDEDCLQTYSQVSWVSLCSSSGNSPANQNGITGTIGGNYPGYANTSVFRNITFQKDEKIAFSQDQVGYVFLGEGGKKVYTNTGNLYSSKPQYQNMISYAIGPIHANRSILSVTEILAVSERLPNKTWKDLVFSTRSDGVDDLFLLSTDGEVFNINLKQLVLNYPKRGLAEQNINPTNDNQVVLADASVFNGANKYEAYPCYVDGTNSNIKFDFIYQVDAHNGTEVTFLAYSDVENKFYSKGVEYKTNATQPTSLTASELHRSTAPSSLKESYLLKEADIINHLFEIFNTKLKLPAKDEVTFWVENTSNRTTFLITEDGYANVITGNTIRRIEFPDGVSAKSYTCATKFAGILGSDGKLYDSGLYSVAFAPIVYTSRSFNHNGTNKTIYENLNLKNKLYMHNATDFNNLTLKSCHGYSNNFVYETTDGILYKTTSVSHLTDNTTFNTNTINYTSLYNLDPISNVGATTNGGYLVVSSQNGITYHLGIASGAYINSTASGTRFANNFAFDDKGVAKQAGSQSPHLWYNFMPL